MVVFDLDKTLLTSDETVSPRTQVMLTALTDKGIIWTVATGRAAGKLQFDGLTDRAVTSWVCASGALTVDVSGRTVTRLAESVLTAEVIAATMEAVL